MTETKYQGVQLAKHWTGWPAGVAYVSVEPKLDGYRLSALIEADGSVSFRCREPEPPKWVEHLGHIALEVQELSLGPGWMLDGEIMAADWNETSKLLRTFRENMTHYDMLTLSQEIKFNVFDVVNLNEIQPLPPQGRQRKTRQQYPVAQRLRRVLLEGLFGGSREAAWALQLVPSFEAFEPEQVDTIYAQCCRDFEGAIVKLPHAPYVFDRTENWLKIKPTETMELTLTHVVEGQGKHVGRLGALVGLTSMGKEVSVGTGFSDAQREGLWAARDLLPGLVCEITAQSGKVATARHPVFQRIRDLG